MTSSHLPSSSMTVRSLPVHLRNQLSESLVSNWSIELDKLVQLDEFPLPNIQLLFNQVNNSS